jgi:uncharacterized membrane protein
MTIQDDSKKYRVKQLSKRRRFRSSRDEKILSAIAEVLNFCLLPEVWTVVETLSPEHQLALVNAIAVIDDSLFTPTSPARE